MTNLLYLNDTYLFKHLAKVINVLENEFGTALILDQTIFYPQGGGQPSDIGNIVSDYGKFEVNNVRLDENGVVLHYGGFTKGEIKVGETVTLLIDHGHRLHSARLHSAGHLLDCAVEIVGLDLIPTKGYHFADGSYVEYEGVIESDDNVKDRIQVAVDELIAQNLKVETVAYSVEEATARDIYAPAGKSVRVVNFEGFDGCGCGGTHIQSSKEIGQIIVRKIKSKKGNTRISYTLES
ncbi:MAG: alanine--tRNA ligase-related protein [Salinivirgaceae bacterium]|nr:alanine--tRNA ligase-related protein [Salinivirgaceae bacterium]MDD4748126.1 alanine--tRNA ligase-related protein [Salinivirgaceae bacterium]MDY0279963.1 alanine--tRNA ligase-related protein [Salinivirgaceae bacterium]